MHHKVIIVLHLKDLTACFSHFLSLDLRRSASFAAESGRVSPQHSDTAVRAADFEHDTNGSDTNQILSDVKRSESVLSDCSVKVVFSRFSVNCDIKSH